jgi:hypothetical protein
LELKRLAYEQLTSRRYPRRAGRTTALLGLLGKVRSKQGNVKPCRLALVILGPDQININLGIRVIVIYNNSIINTM